MSTHAPHEHGAGHGHGVRSEEDRISTVAIVAVGVGSLVVFFIASLVVGRFWHVRQVEYGQVTIPAEVGQNKIGMVEQQLYNGSMPLRPERRRVEQLRRLGSYGWVDEAGGVAHLPIDQAMGLVAKGIRPMPAAPADQAPPPGGQP